MFVAMRKLFLENRSLLSAIRTENELPSVTTAVESCCRQPRVEGKSFLLSALTVNLSVRCCCSGYTLSEQISVVVLDSSSCLNRSYEDSRRKSSTVTLPSVRVHSLLTVAVDEYLSETTKHREKAREMQTERDLAGFYVYQSYLKRLRRLHRNYVRKCHGDQQLQQQQGGRQVQKTSRNSLRPNKARLDDDHDDWPAKTNFRLSMNCQPQTSSEGPQQRSSLAGTVAPPSTARQSLSKIEEEYDEEAELGSRQRPIYIPCGHEPNSLYLLQQQQTKKKTERNGKSGALSFRTWRQIYDQHGSMYST